MSPTRPLPEIDLEHVDTLIGETWNALRNSRVFLTGGTGLFGTWLVESLLFAVRRRRLNCRIPRRWHSGIGSKTPF
jgi:UDP-glucuronate decarboxylase